MRAGFSKLVDSPLIKLVMSLATLLAILFIGIQFAKQWPIISLWDFSTDRLLIVAGLSVVYGLSLFFLAHLWFRLMMVFEPDSIGQKTAYGIYARVQIAKYIPGNIWQFAGRHVYLANYNISHKNILKANFFEIMIMILAAAIVALIFSPYSFGGLYGYLVPFFLVLVTIALSVFIARKNSTGGFKTFKKCAHLTLFALIFFLIQSMVFTSIGAMMGWEISRLLMFTAATSWAIGFIVPGAPGGIGVRELVIYSLLQPIHPESEILIMLTLFRLVTMIGDFICALIGSRIKIRVGKSPTER